MLSKVCLIRKERVCVGFFFCSVSCSFIEMREDEKLLVKNWKLWNPRCAYHRFYLLAFTCCIPFGGHFVKNSMSSLEPMLLRDESFVMDNVMYGGLVSAVSLPNIIMPFLGGKQLDKQGHFGLMRFLVCMVIGQVVFTIAMCMKSYRFACVGRVLFGIGEGSVVVGSRVIVSHWFEKHELSFAMGATVAVANVSKMMAKATVAPVAIYFGGYIYAFWYSTVVCVFSLLMGCVVLKSTGKLRKIISKKIQHGEVVSPEFEWMERPIRNKLSRNTSRVSLPKWTELKQMVRFFEFCIVLTMMDSFGSWRFCIWCLYSCFTCFKMYRVAICIRDMDIQWCVQGM